MASGSGPPVLGDPLSDSTKARKSPYNQRLSRIWRVRDLPLGFAHGEKRCGTCFEHGVALGIDVLVLTLARRRRRSLESSTEEQYHSSTTEVATGSTSLVAPPWAASPDLPGFGFDSVAGRPVWLIWLTAPSGTWRHVNQQSVFSLGNQHAQDEDQEKRRKALSGSRQRSIKRGQAFKRHILTKKTTKNKRQLRGSAAVHETNVASVKAMMPFA